MDKQYLTPDLIGGNEDINVKAPDYSYIEDVGRTSSTPQLQLPDNSLLKMAIAKKEAENATPSGQMQQYDTTGKTQEQIMAETGRQSELDQMGKAGQIPVSYQQPGQYYQNPSQQGQNQQGNVPAVQPTNMTMEGNQGTLFANKAPITQVYGNRSSVEKYSGGVNYGTDFGVPKGTKVAAPPGEWQVVESFNGATAEGPNNAQGGINRGYGNSVLIQNKETGEKMRFSHLTPGGVGVKQGDTLKGGQVFAATGATGNTAGRTGEHLDLEYYAPGSARPTDPKRSAYWNWMTGG